MNHLHVAPSKRRRMQEVARACYADIIGPQSRPILTLAESKARRDAAKARLLNDLAAAGKLL